MSYQQLKKQQNTNHNNDVILQVQALLTIEKITNAKPNHICLN